MQIISPRNVAALPLACVVALGAMGCSRDVDEPKARPAPVASKRPAGRGEIEVALEEPTAGSTHRLHLPVPCRGTITTTIPFDPKALRVIIENEASFRGSYALAGSRSIPVTRRADGKYAFEVNLEETYLAKKPGRYFLKAALIVHEWPDDLPEGRKPVGPQVAGNSVFESDRVSYEVEE